MIEMTKIKNLNNKKALFDYQIKASVTFIYNFCYPFTCYQKKKILNICVHYRVNYMLINILLKKISSFVFTFKFFFLLFPL